MLTYWQSHQEYKAFLHQAKVYFDTSQRHKLFNLFGIREKLISLNLDPVMKYISSYYSEEGRPAQNQPQIFRSFILYAFLRSEKLISCGLTKWVNTILPLDPVYCALIGCSANDLPPLGSYYDFMNRLWLMKDRSRYSRTKTFSASKNKKKPEKPSGKGQKASDHNGITKKLVPYLIGGGDIRFNFESALQDILLIAAVRPSIRKGLVPSEPLTISGDGTCVHTHASCFGHRRHACPYHDACPDVTNCPKHYSDPDAAFGWDSDINDHYFGYTLYNISVHNPDAHVDLPLLVRYTEARRHDSVNGIVALHELRKHAPDMSPRNVCLDSANDNYPTYELLKHWNMNPLIDLNKRSGRPGSVPERISIDVDGTPLCNAGHRMVFWGYDRCKHATKWRSPCVLGKCSQCEHPCSESPYGRTVYTKPEWDIRLYTPIPRGTREWKNVYNDRTSTERINNRILNDYGLHAMRIHGKDHYSFFTMIICICIHLDAWHKTGRTAATTE